MKLKSILFVLVAGLALSGCFHDLPTREDLGIEPSKDEPVSEEERTSDFFENLKVVKHPDVMIKESDVCTSEPDVLEIGREVYPTLPQFGHLTFLGELFTAADCGDERINKIFGVKDGMYNLDPIVLLNENPSSELTSTLEGIGFSCADTTEGQCLVWQLEEIKPVEEILQLADFASEIKSDTCINCG